MDDLMNNSIRHTDLRSNSQRSCGTVEKNSFHCWRYYAAESWCFSYWFKSSQANGEHRFPFSSHCTLWRGYQNSSKIECIGKQTSVGFMFRNGQFEERHSRVNCILEPIEEKCWRGRLSTEARIGKWNISQMCGCFARKFVIGYCDSITSAFKFSFFS